MTFHTPAPSNYTLSDRYALETGRVFMTGTQALVRALFDQARRDRAAGLNTGGFVSGYRGSPLGGLDMELWRQKARLAEGGIEFLPAVNEDLAATAVLGSQQVETNPNRTVDGVFGLWYGKGPGVDRAGDALKHGNAYGSSPHGGVLVVAGDDHGCVSSSMPHQSDVAFMAWFMPTLNPASVAEYLELANTVTRCRAIRACGSASRRFPRRSRRQFLPAQARPRFAKPDFQIPATGLHYRWPDLPGPQIEERMEAKKHAVFAFAEANPIDRAHLRRQGCPLRVRDHRQGASRPDGSAQPARTRRGRAAGRWASTSTRSAWSGRWRGARRWISSGASAKWW
jgi:indolepyruvate ferredoxin oxidoreductase